MIEGTLSRMIYLELATYTRWNSWYTMSEVTCELEGHVDTFVKRLGSTYLINLPIGILYARQMSFLNLLRKLRWQLKGIMILPRKW
jgi:hypothetical protein